MTAHRIDWEGLAGALAGIECSRDPGRLAAASRDYYFYSPILAEVLDGRVGELLVRPRDEAEVVRVAAACARFRVPLTIRGGGTGNYGQCVPLEGGVILDITGLDRVLAVGAGSVLCEAGILIAALERAVRAHGQALLMYPSTRDIATIGGFIAGGYAGVGSIRHGILKDPGNVRLIRVVTVEEVPRVIELRGADIQKVHHAFGTNGIITRLELALAPAVDWLHQILLFPDYRRALEFGVAASRPDLDSFLLTTVERRFARFYGVLGERFPADRDAVFAMVNPAHLDAWRALAARFGGVETLCLDDAGIRAAQLPPAFECAYNHTTLMALRHERSFTYLQIAYPMPFDPALVLRQMERYGDELHFHHEFARQFGEYAVFALPLVAYFDRERVYEIIAEFEADGCLVFDPHVYTIEDGGMKTIDTAQIEFKRVADPHGLMNPGKTRGWNAAMARA
ncbi:MAG: FAD-binding oxidoreductase [Burkholderiales bacterium]|nr:FAD-binding oxidoreductase [Burkholderiales bacterium]